MGLIRAYDNATLAGLMIMANCQSFSGQFMYPPAVVFYYTLDRCYKYHRGEHDRDYMCLYIVCNQCVIATYTVKQ